MTKQTFEITPKVFEFDKFNLRLLTMFKGKYILWPDKRYGPKGYRWALRSWSDNDMGIPTHGGAFSLEDAARGVVENKMFRDQIKEEASLAGS